MKRHEALKVISDCITNEFVVVCNGMISREFHAIKDRNRNFYMLGSMGLAPAIGLGVALSKPDKKVVSLLGDGNMLMSLGTLATIGKTSPKNLTLVVIDNGCHESTGGQETASNVTAFDAIAASSGIGKTARVDSIEGLSSTLKTFLTENGPSLINARVEKGRVDAPRIRVTPVEMRDRFTSELKC
jgi:sulfopyruvate decarboxylase subunit beta